MSTLILVHLGFLFFFFLFFLKFTVFSECALFNMVLTMDTVKVQGLFKDIDGIFYVIHENGLCWKTSITYCLSRFLINSPARFVSKILDGELIRACEGSYYFRPTNRSTNLLHVTDKKND